MTVIGGEGNDNLLVATDNKGLIDYSFIDKTNGTNLALSMNANKLVQTLDNGIINISLLPVSLTGTSNAIPRTGSNNTTINNSWINSTINTIISDKFVLTNAQGKVDNNLLKIASSSASDTIIVGDGNGKINDNWLYTTTNGLDNPNGLLKLTNGKLNTSVIPDDQYIPISGGVTDGNIIINGESPNANTDKILSNDGTVTYTGLNNLKSALPNFVGVSGNSYQDGFLLGMNGTSNTNNYLMLATYDEGKEPIYVRQYTGNPGYSGLTQKNQITLMDENGYTSLNKLTVNNDISSTNGGLSVKGNISSSNGNLSIKGTSTLTGAVNIDDSLTVAKNLDIVDGNIIINSNTSYPSDPVNQAKLASELPNFSGFSSCSFTDGCLIGMNLEQGATADTDTYLLISTYDNGTEPIIFRQYASWNKTGDFKQHFAASNVNHEVTLMDKRGNTSLNGLTVQNNLVVNGTSTVTGTSTLTGKLTANGGIGTTTLTTSSTITSTGLISAKGGITIGANKTLSITEPSNTRTRTAMVASTVNNDGDNIYYTGGGNLTGVFGGDSYSTWWNYVKDGITNTYWPISINTYNDQLYLMSDNEIHIQSCIQTGYQNRKDFIFDNNGDFTAPRGIIASQSIFTSTTDADGTIDRTPALQIGTHTGYHLEFDPNEIMAKSNATTPSALYINSNGGLVSIGSGGLSVSGDINADNLSGKWVNYTNSIGTKVSTTNTSTSVVVKDGTNLKYTTLNDVASAIKSTINSGIDMSSKAPMPTTSSGVGQVILISNATFTLPNGGTWFVWFYRSKYDSDYQDGMNAYSPYVNDDPTQKVNGKLIWPGGTKFNALSGQNASNGFAWRIQ